MKMLNFKFVQFLLFLHLLIFCTTALPQTKKTYIIHMDKSAKPKTFTNHIDWFETSLKSVSNSAEILYTYKHVTHGFSTRLTSQEANTLSKQQGVLSITPEVIYKLHTTRTPQFLGLSPPSTLLPPSNQESQVIIGVLDTGIWPEQESLHDTDLGPIPSHWKGGCEISYNMNSSSCNKKLIGVRFFSKGFEGTALASKAKKSARDKNGHGTHTLTTAAGSIVPNASLFGLASGTARGMAPHARVAAYKVCWDDSCSDSDIAAGIDQAIEDGVHIISMSLGSIIGPVEYYKDLMAIGGFSAMSHGIFVSAAAGNQGPDSYSLGNNVAPWLTTVGAGTIDRDFPAYVILGNGKKFTGASLYNDKPLPDKFIPVVYAGNVSNSPDGYCEPDTLIPSKVVGKIVICEIFGSSDFGLERGLIVKNAGGIGMILVNGEYFGEDITAEAHLLPAANIGEKASNIVKNYVFTSSNPTAKILFGGTVVNVQPSPVVAKFSARGPNSLTPKILKPDLIAPGVNILAGWTGANGPSDIKEDKRHVSFNIVSGTSMACPHVTGLAAILKGAHPEWSPAVIKSALMTTSYRSYKNGQTILDIATGKPATPFDFGAGHVDPISALDPGLVYDADVDDYLGFLCGLNYTSSQIKVVARRAFVCDSKKTYRLEDFNYPSFAVPLETAPKTVKYSRVLTNVGTPGIYKASVNGFSKGSAVKVLVEPEILEFKEVNEKKSYTVTFTCGYMSSGTNGFAYLEWADGKHTVVSPIAISWA